MRYLTLSLLGFLGSVVATVRASDPLPVVVGASHSVPCVSGGFWGVTVTIRWVTGTTWSVRSADVVVDPAANTGGAYRIRQGTTILWSSQSPNIPTVGGLQRTLTEGVTVTFESVDQCTGTGAPNNLANPAAATDAAAWSEFEPPCVPGPKVVAFTNDTPLEHTYRVVGYGDGTFVTGSIVSEVTLPAFSARNVTITTDGSLDRFQAWLMWDGQYFSKVDEWVYASDCDPEAGTVADDPDTATPQGGGDGDADDPTTNPDTSSDAEAIVRGLKDFPVAGTGDLGGDVDETAGDAQAAAISDAMDGVDGQLQGVAEIPVPSLPTYSTSARKYVYDANVELPGVGTKNIGFNVSAWATWIELFRSMVGFLLVFLSIRKSAEILRGAFSG